jgi:hypothetical protein
MLLQLIKEKQSDKDLSEIANLLGYTNSKKGVASIEKLLSYTTLLEWLRSGHYDFKYNSEQLIKNLSIILDIDTSFVNINIFDAHIKMVLLEKLENTYIFVHTNFKRGSEPIFTLAFSESLRRIHLDASKLIDKTLFEIFFGASKTIVSHYEQAQGKLGIWGDITGYSLYLFQKTYSFNPQGELSKIDTEIPSPATIKVL